jgi:hypothetical protein
LFCCKGRLLTIKCKSYGGFWRKKSQKIIGPNNMIYNIMYCSFRVWKINHFNRQRNMSIVVGVLLHDVIPHDCLEDLCGEENWLEQNANECKHVLTMGN